jgi:predicted nucleic acid-binding protein
VTAVLVLDTDVLIDVQRGHPAALAWFAGLPDLPSVPGIVVMELIQGAKDAKQVREALRLTAPLPVVWPTPADCQRALADFTAFHLSHGLGLLDALIASVAVGLSAELCTFNDKHYRVVPRLVTLQPYTR